MATVNYKAKEIGCKFSNYKCKYKSFANINNGINDQSDKETFDNKINNNLSYSNPES